MKVLSDALRAHLHLDTVFLVDDQRTASHTLSSTSASEIWCLEDAYSIISEVRPLLTVVDMLETEDSWVEEIRHISSAKMVVLENDCKSADVLINAIIWGVNNGSLAYGRGIAYYGPKYSILDPKFIELRNRNTRLATDVVSHVIVSIGGGDLCNLTEAIVYWVIQALPSVRVSAIYGPSVPIDTVQEATSRLRRVSASIHVVQNPANRIDMLASADVCIINGGMTLYEASCLGVPSIVIPQVDHERHTALLFQGRGATLLSVPKREVFIDHLLTLCRRSDVRAFLSRNGKCLVPGSITPVIEAISLGLLC